MKDNFTFEGFEPANTTPVPDVLFDELLSELSEAELKVLLYIIRRTAGFKKPTDAISLTQFQKGIRKRATGEILDRGCGVKDRATIIKALASLEQKHCIHSTKADDPSGDKATSTYRILFRSEVVGKTNHPLAIGSGQNQPPWFAKPTTVVGDSNYGVVGKANPQETVLQDTDSQETVLQDTDSQETVLQDTDSQETVLQEREGAALADATSAHAVMSSVAADTGSENASHSQLATGNIIPPKLTLKVKGRSDVHSDVDSHPAVLPGGDAGAGSGVPDLHRDRSAAGHAGIQEARGGAIASGPVETALSEIIPSSPSHTGGAARNRPPQGDESRAPDADTFPALSQDAGQAVGEGNGAVQASGEPVLSRSGERPKRARKPPIEQPAGPPQEPPADMAWGTRKCLLLFDYWRGAHLIGKWKLQKASECALGLAKQYSQDYVTAAKEVMDADSYWSDQGGVDICSMANNIHKYRRKIERKLGVQRNAAVLDFSKAVCIDTQFRVYQVPGDDREWILWEGEYLSPEEADKRGYNGGFGLYNVTEYDFVPNGIGRGVS